MISEDEILAQMARAKNLMFGSSMPRSSSMVMAAGVVDDLCTLALKAARFEKALEYISGKEPWQTEHEEFVDGLRAASRMDNRARTALAGDGGALQEDYDEAHGKAAKKFEDDTRKY